MSDLDFRMGSRMCNYCRRNLPSPDLCGCDGEKAARVKSMTDELDRVGPRKMGTDTAHIAAQLREISRISNKYDLRECIEGHDDALGDSFIWRDLMDQCDILAASLDRPKHEAFFGRATSLGGKQDGR